MNRVFLVGEIITDIEFKFIINSKNISVAMFKIKTIKDNQIINIKAYNDKADCFFSKCNKGDIVVIEGMLQDNTVIVN